MSLPHPNAEPFKILIVEDELIIAESIKQLLLLQGYTVVGIAPSAIEAIDFLTSHAIDLVLLDITLAGERNGIWLAQYLRKQYHLPFVFLTSHADEKTLKEALFANPDSYVLKPFTQAELTTTIEIAYQKFSKQHQENEVLAPPSFLLKDGLAFTKVPLSETFFIKSDKNYLEVHHTGGLTKVRGSIKEFRQAYTYSTLVQVHRSYLVNIHAVTGYDAFDVLMNDLRLPLGSNYKANFVSHFKKYYGLPEI